MAYHIYLFRKEVKSDHLDLSFLENESAILKFTDTQFSYLHDRLLRYGFQIESKSLDSVYFKKNNATITAVLTPTQLSLSSSFSLDDLFEIGMTASEFTDIGEFAKLDPQTGEWEINN